MNNSFLNNLDNEPVRRIDDRRKIKLLGLVILLVVIFLTIIFATKTATAKRDNNSYRIKQIASVEIKKGDTLWSIASTYISDEYKDMNEYIEEIMISNRLSSDTVHAGSYIIVPYYVDVSIGF